MFLTSSGSGILPPILEFPTTAFSTGAPGLTCVIGCGTTCDIFCDGACLLDCGSDNSGGGGSDAPIPPGSEPDPGQPNNEDCMTEETAPICTEYISTFTPAGASTMITTSSTTCATVTACYVVATTSTSTGALETYTLGIIKPGFPFAFNSNGVSDSMTILNPAYFTVVSPDATDYPTPTQTSIAPSTS